ncbi:carbon-nitrogen hydrolase family protein [Conexibacter sp. CPCC 206217]|uniref:carbon-nitrogen hydrolase family protein n=1 Tax=Conexibacter sp. CPCC 206217 TaxID=3064574 RepID=UPI00271B0346|nr:carbon-nitrogen hydrolase family protein [Conexibacter sp. CPCC 206217]MDO8209438.1 carbon-nitrogen hydrolase family protein [Conexibacter sp. CPCC 206217]
MRAAAIQMNSTEDRDRNLAVADRLVRAAARDGAALVALPEKWSVLGTPEQLAAGAETLDGPAISWARATARELQIDLVAGSIVEHVEGREKRSNTSVHVGPDGEIRATYRKVHLFDVEVSGTAYRESDGEEPGEELVTSALGSAPVAASAAAAGDDAIAAAAEPVELGMAICYDLRFPELFRILALRGAHVVTLPSAFTLATTRDHWEVLVRARAIENQCFVVAPNQIGAHPPGNRSGGRSMIVDPWGLVLALAPDDEGHVVAELDLERQRQIRATLPSLANRRPQTYAWPEQRVEAAV